MMINIALPGSAGIEAEWSVLEGLWNNPALAREMPKLAKTVDDSHLNTYQ
ncbi:MAG: hypothetical protein ABF326_10495 [Arenicellales bacterium]